MSPTIYTSERTGEVLDAHELKEDVVDKIKALVGVVWQEVCSEYQVAPLTGLDIAGKMVAAATGGAIKEQKDILAEPFKPQQTKMAL